MKNTRKQFLFVENENKRKDLNFLKTYISYLIRRYHIDQLIKGRQSYCTSICTYFSGILILAELALNQVG